MWDTFELEASRGLGPLGLRLKGSRGLGPLGLRLRASRGLGPLGLRPKVLLRLKSSRGPGLALRFIEALRRIEAM